MTKQDKWDRFHSIFGTQDNKFVNEFVLCNGWGRKLQIDALYMNDWLCIERGYKNEESMMEFIKKTYGDEAFELVTEGIENHSKYN